MMSEHYARRYQWKYAVENRWGDNYDAVCIDTLTGKEVYRYDMGDPANTNPECGGMSQNDMLLEKGLDPHEKGWRIKSC